MKRFLSFALILCALLLYASLPAHAAKKEIPELCKPILEAWGVSNAKELAKAVLKDREEKQPKTWKSLHKGAKTPVDIQLGGTTKELLKNYKEWDVAILSSKEVDLQKLADAGLIHIDNVPNPVSFLSLEQWAYPEAVQQMLPDEPMYHSCVFCYDYDPETDEAVLIIWNEKGRPRRWGRHTARQLLERRTPDQIRAVEGLCRKIDWENFGMPEMTLSEEELIAHPDEWDWAFLRINKDYKLDKLDAAGLLYDFSQHEYWRERSPEWEWPSGIWNEEGRLIAIPYHHWNYDGPDTLSVFVINAKSPVIPRALAFAEHYIKSFEWDDFGRLTYYSDPKTMRDNYVKDFEIGYLCILKKDVNW